jgi:hypothetical protein
VRKTATLFIDAQPDDRILLDFEVFGEHTHNDNDITGVTQCTATGSLFAVKLKCDWPSKAPLSFSPPAISPFAIDVNNPNDPAITLLNLLAWCVTAAAVAGLIIIGAGLALQLRRGEPGEFSEHFRGTYLVAGACILGMTAGPIIEFLHIY